MLNAHSRILRFIFICLGVIGFAGPRNAGAQDHLSASFGEWHTFCDKGRICDAYTYSGWETVQDPSSGHVFNVRRHPGAREWTIHITFEHVEPKLSLGVQASVIRMGHDQEIIPPFGKDALVLQSGRLVTGSADLHRVYLLVPSAEPLMQQLRPGDFMYFDFGGCGDEFLNAGFSLAGVTAALAWIDKVQGMPEGSVEVAHSASGTKAEPFPNCEE